MATTKILLLTVLCACSAFAQQGAVYSGISPIPTVTPGTMVPADSQQFVFLGPNIADLTISYPSRLVPAAVPGNQITLVVKALNQVKPVVSTTVSRNSAGTYDYSFAIQNDPSASDAIEVWSIAMPAVDAASSATHTSWSSTQEPVGGNPNPPVGTVSMFPVALITWRSPTETSIAPGGITTSFQVESPYLPGFTTVYARSGEDYAVPMGLPASVNAQLQIMRQRDWINNKVMAIGPRFPRAWTKDVIAADFKDGIAHLERAGALDASSRFVVALSFALDTFIGAAGATVPLNTIIPLAATPMEKNIANAISISLQ